MTSRTAKLIVSVLVLASLLTLSLSFAGLLPAAASETAANGPAADGTVPAASGNTTLASVTAAPSPVPTIALRPMAVAMADPEPTPAQGMRSWPAASSIDAVHQVDLAAYAGRAGAERPLQGITVILDPGHGGKDGGTCYPSQAANPEIIEKNITLAVALQTRDLLVSQGATVALTRQKDDWISVYNRVAQVGSLALSRFITDLPGKGYDSTAVDYLVPKLADMIRINSDTADSGGRGLMLGVGASTDARLLLDIQRQYADVLFISLHCNAMGDGTAIGGLQIFYQTSDSNYKKETSTVKYQNSADHPPAYMAYDDAGRQKLASCLYKNIIKQAPQLESTGNSGSLIGDYAVLREINLVSALVEMGFVTCPSDRTLLKDPDGQRKLAQGVANAVLAYYCGDAAN